MYIRFTVYRRNENSRAVRDSFREKKKTGEENPHRGGIIRQKWHRLFRKRVFPRVQPRSRGSRAETFPGNLSTRVENESAAVYSRVRSLPFLLRRETFLI